LKEEVILEFDFQIVKFEHNISNLTPLFEITFGF